MLTKVTRILVLITIVLLVGYDIFVYFKGQDSTISQVIYTWAKGYPIVPFLFGMLMGHFFWPNSKASDEKII